MTYRIRTLATLAAALSALLVSAPAADASQPADDDCANGVSTAEWFNLQEGLDGPNGGARRSVIEESWDVTPVGYRNRYWQPAGDKVYSYAYNFCQNPEVVIVLVYRKTSGAWQYALKGEFAPVDV